MWHAIRVSLKCKSTFLQVEAQILAFVQIEFIVVAQIIKWHQTFSVILFPRSVATT